ncbi:hypothetical protein F4779DRAFT_366926 [Xylariaceae sp. FL0662B]|nr:hypothetical protein F4779DRAFT_366926 [Xylariaceae sp. FL0662B]
MDSQPFQTADQSRLLTIPLEILLHIVSYLTTPEYGSLRATCQHVEASLFKPFANEFFTKRQFMLTEFSLQALVDISKSRFASGLTHLIIGLDRPAEASHYTRVLTYEEAVKKNRLHEEHISHQHLINTNQDVEYLAEAINNLPNLETVGLRDFSSHGRHRDGESCKWRSYGLRTIAGETGVPLDLPGWGTHPSSQYVIHAFFAILRALGDARAKGSHSVTRLEVILRGCGVPDIGFSIPRRLEMGILPVLANLKVLYLDLDSITPPVLVGNEADFTPFPLFFLSKFLLTTQSLEHLRINFSGYNKADRVKFLLWLSKAPAPCHNTQTAASTTTQANGVDKERNGLQEYPPPPHFPNLEQLDIGMVTIESSLLLGLFQRYKATLRRVSLHRVCLKATAQHTRDRVNLWPRFFSQMAKLHLNLSTINLSYLQQSRDMGAFFVRFKDSTQNLDPLDRASSFKNWVGCDLEHAYKDFINSVTIDWPESASDEEYIESTDGSMDGNEGEDEDEDEDDDLII